jgi:hypothetical protein
LVFHGILYHLVSSCQEDFCPVLGIREEKSGLRSSYRCGKFRTRSLRTPRLQHPACNLVIGCWSGTPERCVRSHIRFATLYSEVAAYSPRVSPMEGAHVQVEADSHMRRNCCCSWRSLSVVLWSPNHQLTDGTLSVPKATRRREDTSASFGFIDFQRTAPSGLLFRIRI